MLPGALTIGIIKQALQSGAQIVRKPRGPGLINQSSLNEIQEMHLIFPMKAVQLHLDECL